MDNMREFARDYRGMVVWMLRTVAFSAGIVAAREHCEDILDRWLASELPGDHLDQLLYRWLDTARKASNE